MEHVSLLGLASRDGESHLGHVSSEPLPGFQHRPLAVQKPKICPRAAFLAQGGRMNTRGGSAALRLADPTAWTSLARGITYSSCPWSLCPPLASCHSCGCQQDAHSFPINMVRTNLIPCGIDLGKAQSWCCSACGVPHRALLRVTPVSTCLSG